MAKLRPRYMQAMIAWKDSQHLPVYPDANSSLRVTYGNVQGVAPRDAVSYSPFTTAEGIVEKTTGGVSFNASKAQADVIKAKAYDGYASKQQGTLPVDFLADLDMTGGNSGSPALGGQGQLVGLAFDANCESVSGTGCSIPSSTAPSKSMSATCSGSCIAWTTPTTCSRKWVCLPSNYLVMRCG